MSRIHETSLGNYYGYVEIINGDDGVYYIALDNYSSTSAKAISGELYSLLMKELVPEENRGGYGL